MVDQICRAPADPGKPRPFTDRSRKECFHVVRFARRPSQACRNPLSEHDVPFFGGNQILVFLGVRATSAGLSMLFFLANGLVYVSPLQRGVTHVKNIDRRYEVGLPGLVDLLIQTRGAPVASMPQQMLDTLSNQAANVRAAAVAGVGALADLVSGHNASYSQLDHVGVGWLLHSLHDLLTVAETVRQEVSGAATNCLAATITKERQ
jgi:hypothetical protein